MGRQRELERSNGSRRRAKAELATYQTWSPRLGHSVSVMLPMAENRPLTFASREDGCAKLISANKCDLLKHLTGKDEAPGHCLGPDFTSDARAVGARPDFLNWSRLPQLLLKP
jgi:hypothetical protein